MTTLFYLDLEETIINNWDERLIINAQKIRTFLEERSVQAVGIFSFAIWNDDDQDTFEADLKAPLERVLGVKINHVPNMQHMMRADKRHTGVHLDDVHEYITLRGKQQGFVNYFNHNHPDLSAVLIDDVVEDVILTYKKSGRSIEFINVNSIE